MGSKVKSGTAPEVRGAASAAGGMFGDLFRSGDYEQVISRVASPFQRMAMQSMMGTLGFDPGAVGLESAITRSLIDPRDRTAGLFAAMEPFEMRSTNQQVTGLRDSMGSMGGRFSRNLLSAEGDLRTKLSQGFALEREKSLLEAGGLQNQAIANLMAQLIAARSTSSGEALGALEAILGYIRPGEAIFDPGLGRSLLGAAVQGGAMYAGMKG